MRRSSVDLRGRAREAPHHGGRLHRVVAAVPAVWVASDALCEISRIAALSSSAAAVALAAGNTRASAAALGSALS